MRTGLLLGALLTIFALGAWLLLAPPHPAPEGELAPADGAAGGSRATPAAAATADAAGAVDRDAANLDADASDAALRARFPGRAEFRVRVVDEDDAPVPHAALRLLYSDGRDRRAFDRALQELALDVERLAEREGLLIHADASGEARLPRPAEWLYLVARKDERLGVWYYLPDRDGDLLTIQIERDLTLRVRVLDPDGAPVAGVPVALQSGSQGWGWQVQTAPSDAEGRVTMRHVQHHLPESSARHLEVTLGIPLADPPLHVLRRTDFPQEEIELRLPATGSVRVELLDRDGKPPAAPTPVALQRAWQERGPWFAPNLFYERGDLGLTSAEARAGAAHFARVGLGLRLEAGAGFDRSGDRVRVEFQGPTQPGETVVAVLRAVTVRPVLAARVLRPDGRPLADASLTWFDHRTESPDQWSNGGASETDAEGRMECALAPEGNGPDRRFDVTWTDPETRVRHAAFAPIPEGWLEGRRDAGDLRLTPMQPLAAGRVVDADGAPVSYASVMSQRWRAWQNEANSGWWQPESLIHERSDADGKFTLWAVDLGVRRRLVITHARFQPHETELRVGGLDHVIILAPAQVLMGKVLLDDDILPGDLMVRFTLDGTEHEGVMTRTGSSASFRLDGLTPGRGCLAIHCSATREELWSLDGIAAHGQDEEPDARLAPLDLRGQLDGIRLEVVGADGKPVSGFQYGIVRVDDETELREVHGNAAAFVATRSPHRIRVQAAGFAPLETPVRAGENRIVLGDGWRITLRLVDPGVVRERHVGVLTSQPGEEREWRDDWMRAFDAAGEMRLGFEQTGTQLITPYVLYRTTAEEMVLVLVDEAAITVELTGASGVLERTLPLTEAQILAAIQAQVTD